MKKGKLLLLLVAIMSLAVAFAACDSASDGTETSTNTVTESETDTEISTQTDTDTEVPNDEIAVEETIAEVKDEQEGATHELLSFFELPKLEEADKLESISRLEGEIKDYDNSLNLAVVETKDLDNLNQVIHTLTVYDLLSGEVILTESVTYPYGAGTYEKTELSVELKEYVIRVVKTTCTLDEGDIDDPDDDSEQYTHDVSYYPIKGGEAIYTTDSNTFEMMSYDNGLVSILMGDKIFWMDKNYDVVRTIDLIVAGDYDVDFYGSSSNIQSSEYMGYIYNWTEYRLFIFNRGGMVSGIFDAAEYSTIQAHVLNNGNVLIQEFTEVGATDSCDFVYRGTRYTLQSYIMDLVYGETSELELDFIVTELETAYEQGDYANPKLKAGVDSYATVYRVANGNVAHSPIICVLDNDINVLYTVENKNLGVNLGELFAVLSNGRYYSTVIQEGNQEYYAIFDYDGNLVSHYDLSGGGSTEKYVVTSTALYDYSMNCVYELEKNGYEYIEVVNGNIYLSKLNFNTGCEELYVIRSESKAPELVCDGVDYEVEVRERFYIVHDIENDVYVLYNIEGEELLVSHEQITVMINFNDVTVLSSSFNGEPILYVVK